MTMTLSANNPSANPYHDTRDTEIPPTSNTGGNSDKNSATTLSTDSFVAPVHIDTLSLTGSLDVFGTKDCTLPDVPKNISNLFTDEQRINWLSTYLSRVFGVCLSGDTLRGVNHYKNQKKLYYTDGRPQKALGHVAWDNHGRRDSFQIYCTGEFCEYLNLIGRMKYFKVLAEGLSMKITRSDLAYDDIDGIHSVDDAVEYYKSGGFTFTRAPSISQFGNWITPDTKGRTVNIGSRDSGKLLRVYEKGKQLGDFRSPWVRWEMELHNKDRVIPLDVLTDPAKYFVGCYPALRDFVVGTVAQAIKTVKKKAKITVDRSLNMIREQVGKYIHVLSKTMAPADFISRISTEGVPPRLILPIPVASKPIDIPDDFYDSLVPDSLGVVY